MKTPYGANEEMKTLRGWRNENGRTKKNEGVFASLVSEVSDFINERSKRLH